MVRGWNLFAAGLLALMMAFSFPGPGPNRAIGAEGRSSTVEGPDNDLRNNDDFTTAQEFASGDFLDGTTGLDDPHRIDTYVLRDVPAGKVVNASCLMTNFNGPPGEGQSLMLTGWNRYHVDALAWSNREDNPDRRPWEAVSFLCVVSGDYYIQLKPIAGKGTIFYRLNIQAFDPEDITSKIGTGGAFGTTLAGQVSSFKWYPGHWYKFTMSGETNGMNEYLYVNMTEPGAPDQRLWGDIYVRNLEAESFSYWLNHSWWLDSFVQYEEVHAAACHPGPATYYLDIQAYNTSGGRSENYELRLTMTQAESDGDNHPLNAAPVTYENGKATVRRTGSVERGPDMFDWYKVYLDKGEGVSANLTLLEKSSAIFRLSIYRDNLTGGYDLMSSWTNKPADTVLNRVNALTTNVSQEGWYYIAVIAQIGIQPGNASNLCDWTAQTARAKYQLDITLPICANAPYIVHSPEPILITEDGSDSSLELNFTGANNGVFTDDDFKEEWGETLTFSCGYDQHLQVSINNADPAAPATISPARDWNGESELVFAATDLYGKTCSTTIHVSVTGENDPPFVKARIPDFSLWEGKSNDTMKDIDLFAVFGDPDLGPFGGDNLSFTVDNTQFPATITDNKITFGTAPVFPGKENHVVTAWVAATDRAGLKALQAVNITVVNLQHRPEANESRIEILEDVVSHFDLNQMFYDPDGDPLVFVYLGGATANLTVEVAPNGSAVLTPAHDYYTRQEILRFRAIDTQGSNGSGELVVRIRDTPFDWADAPDRVDMVPDPLEEWWINENEPIIFRITVVDADLKPADLRYSWFIDGTEKTRLGTSSFT